MTRLVIFLLIAGGIIPPVCAYTDKKTGSGIVLDTRANNPVNEIHYSNLFFDLGRKDKAYLHYGKALGYDPLLEFLADKTRAELVQRFFSYEDAKNIAHLIEEGDPRFNDRALTDPEKEVILKGVLLEKNGAVQMYKDYQKEKEVVFKQKEKEDEKQKEQILLNKIKEEMAQKSKKEETDLNKLNEKGQLDKGYGSNDINSSPVKDKESNFIMDNLLAISFSTLALSMGVLVWFLLWIAGKRDRRYIKDKLTKGSFKKSKEKLLEIRDMIQKLEAKRESKLDDANFPHMVCIKAIGHLSQNEKEVSRLIGNSEKLNGSDDDIIGDIDMILKDCIIAYQNVH